MTKIIFFGDNDTTADAVKILDAIKKETAVDQYVFLGDGPYATSGTKWVGMMKPYFPDLSKLVLVQGNHDNEESESAKTEADIEAWKTDLKQTPETGGTDPSWEKPKWLTSKQVGDVYLIGMNSQDMDIEFKGRNQYNWVVKQLGKAMALRQAGKINWIINAVHKPWFTLKSSHSPYTAVREIYSDIFKGVVDMNFHGHNHNDQAWFPMVATKTSGNAAGEPLFTLAADGKTLDYSKDRGWSTNICGHSGHEHNFFKEDATGNKNVMWANDKTFSYVIAETDPATKKINIKWKDVAGKVLFEYNVTRAGMATTQAPPPPTGTATTDPNAPTSAPPSEGFRWDPSSKQWVPKLEDPAFLKQKQGITPTTPPPPPTATTPPPPQTPPLPPADNVIWDSNVHLKTGKPFIVNDTLGDQKPNSKGLFMAASGSPRLLVDPDGTFHLEADPGHGRVYIRGTNFNARLEGDFMFEDSNVDNSTWRLRSRHNMPEPCENKFGGIGYSINRDSVGHKTESCHNFHENSF